MDERVPDKGLIADTDGQGLMKCPCKRLRVEDAEVTDEETGMTVEHSCSFVSVDVFQQDGLIHSHLQQNVPADLCLLDMPSGSGGSSEWQLLKCTENFKDRFNDRVSLESEVSEREMLSLENSVGGYFVKSCSSDGQSQCADRQPADQHQVCEFVHSVEAMVKNDYIRKSCIKHSISSIKSWDNLCVPQESADIVTEDVYNDPDYSESANLVLVKQCNEPKYRENPSTAHEDIYNDFKYHDLNRVKSDRYSNGANKVRQERCGDIESHSLIGQQSLNERLREKLESEYDNSGIRISAHSSKCCHLYDSSNDESTVTPERCANSPLSIDSDFSCLESQTQVCSIMSATCSNDHKPAEHFPSMSSVPVNEVNIKRNEDIEKVKWNAFIDKVERKIKSPFTNLTDSGFLVLFSKVPYQKVISCKHGNSVVYDVAMETDMEQQNSNDCTSETYDENNGNADGDHMTVTKPRNECFILNSEEADNVNGNINRLPYCVLVQIFQNFSPFMLLNKVSQVCKYWYNVSRDPDLWRDLIMTNHCKLTDEFLLDLLKFSDYRAKTVNLTECRFITNHGIQRLLEKCRNLHVLKLIRCVDLNDTGIAGMRTDMPNINLHSLYLDGCSRLTDGAVTQIAQCCPNLKHLHLNQCIKVTSSGAKVLAQHCSQLTELQFDHSEGVGDEGVIYIVNGCPNMRCLHLVSCCITDTGIMLLSRLTSLTKLDLSSNSRMTAKSLVYISQFCKKLESINISLNRAIGDQCIGQILMNLPALKKLYCVSCNITDIGLEDIAKYCPTLEGLDVGWCHEISDRGVRVVSLACKKLEYFGLIRCDKVTMETMEELVPKFPRINYSTFMLETRRLLQKARKEGYDLKM